MIEKHAFIPISLYELHSHIRPHAISIGDSKVITYAESEKGEMRALADSTGYEIKENPNVSDVISAIESGINAIYVCSTKQALEVSAYFAPEETML